MTIDFSEGAKRSARELDRFERTITLRLPDDYRRFLAANDGARPADNRFAFRDNAHCSVNRFIPIQQIAAQSASIDDLADTRITIAWAEGGNFVCLDTRGGVYFWDHEEPHIDYRLADSFDDFLTLLQPASVDDVTLDPAQVEYAWIDPEILEQAKKRR